MESSTENGNSTSSQQQGGGSAPHQQNRGGRHDGMGSGRFMGSRRPNPNMMESSTENGNSTLSQQQGGESAPHQQNRGGGHGGMGSGRFMGNRRPNPNMINEFGGRTRMMNRGPNQGGPREQGGPGGRNPDDRLNEKVAQLSGPTFDIPSVDTSEKQFSGRSRQYIGNIAAQVQEDEINDMFKRYGETGELFVNRAKNFGFIRLDFHANAEKAKRELDGTVLKGRTLKICFAPNGSTVKIKNLTHFVSNELLYCAFSVFGEADSVKHKVEVYEFLTSFVNKRPQFFKGDKKNSLVVARDLLHNVHTSHGGTSNQREPAKVAAILRSTSYESKRKVASFTTDDIPQQVSMDKESKAEHHKVMGKQLMVAGLYGPAMTEYTKTYTSEIGLNEEIFDKRPPKVNGRSSYKRKCLL